MWLVVVLLALPGGEEPLSEAARTGNTAALRSLLDSGADIDTGNRAARMLEQMQDTGVVGPLQSNGAREVLASPPPA